MEIKDFLDIFMVIVENVRCFIQGVAEFDKLFFLRIVIPLPVDVLSRLIQVLYVLSCSDC